MTYEIVVPGELSEHFTSVFLSERLDRPWAEPGDAPTRSKNTIGP